MGYSKKKFNAIHLAHAQPTTAVKKASKLQDFPFHLFDAKGADDGGGGGRHSQTSSNDQHMIIPPFSFSLQLPLARLSNFLVFKLLRDYVAHVEGLACAHAPDQTALYCECVIATRPCISLATGSRSFSTLELWRPALPIFPILSKKKIPSHVVPI
ncbi:hypothetical protein L7F22_037407 [Adiantum nelumboides]|nr:hypothetical protein [Adiantum nelumboides]